MKLDVLNYLPSWLSRLICFFFSSHKGAQGGIGFPGLKGQRGAKVIFFFNQPLFPNSGDGNVMSKPTSVEVDFYYYCLIAIDM